MNIFVLDLDVDKCAKYHVDKHSTKMCVEYAQLLCGVHHIINENKYLIPYRLTHKNHPCSIWVRDCTENYIWLCKLALELCYEYTFRYGKIHKSQAVVEWAYKNIPNLPSKGKTTPFALAIPIDCKGDDVVESYRSYYKNHKQNIASWKTRGVPKWFS